MFAPRSISASHSTHRRGDRRVSAGLAALLVGLQILVGLPWLPAGVAPAQAQLPRPRVWIAPLQSSGAPGLGLMSEKFDEAVRQQLGKSQRLLLTDTDTGNKQVEAGQADPRVDRAENLRVAAKAAFLAGKFEDAQKQFKAALELYEEGLASVRSVGVIAETLGFLGATSVKMGFDADAEDYFGRVVSLMPDAQAMDEYDPKSRALFDEVRKKALKKKPGNLIVNTVPPGAAVKVDGVDRGNAPVTIKGLQRGDHYVQAASADAGLAGERVRVKGGKDRTVTLTLENTVGPKPAAKADPALVTSIIEHAREGRITQSFRDQAEAIAAQTRADYIVVGAMSARGNGFVLTAYVYGVEQKQTAAFDEYAFRADLASVFVQASNFSTAVEAAVTKFPFDKVVMGQLVVAPVVPVTPIAPPRSPATTAASVPPVVVASAPPARRDPPPGIVAATSQNNPRREDDAKGDDHWYEKWWVWTVIGVAVAGGAVAGGYLLSQDDGSSSDSFNAEVRW